jgi:hypothetical protein
VRDLEEAICVELWIRLAGLDPAARQAIETLRPRRADAAS